MTHTFKRGGCTTLDWLVTKDVVGSAAGETHSNMDRHTGL
jgi:hypothetical protein